MDQCIVARGVTRRELADAIGAHVMGVHAFADGSFPDLPTAAKLVRVLGVTLNGLLDGCADLEPANQTADATA
jgi:hypothetical protein